MEKTTKLPTAGLLVIQNKRLLLAFSRNKKAWYLPGGKIDQGETAISGLIREIKEELNLTINQSELTYYCHISAPAYGENKNLIMEQECYLYDLNENISPSSEIEAVRFFSLEDYKNEPAQVIGVLLVFEKLIADKLCI
ncbi:NUDIX domain-containing protein [Sphingobacterium sp. UT-1RO-CII-1]|uniref:NUDIX hydrolase n=1 Tax=Sphingobacterium sp. UT-1RO-CII-1 TaxID=2995225 RepID=UPI00227A4D45|nr:NUDIX domain-containing protein [Sphingobacterium sp. UT-1RO-CII-1]MCY4779336.1 NUDIX domain-containing protein [Sphingobacterium sp. UT-1RO-CII-1]